MLSNNLYPSNRFSYAPHDSSSELSPQSSLKSQKSDRSIHLSFLHLKDDSLHPVKIKTTWITLFCHLRSVHTKKCMEHPFLAISTNANVFANAQFERKLRIILKESTQRINDFIVTIAHRNSIRHLPKYSPHARYRCCQPTSKFRPSI